MHQWINHHWFRQWLVTWPATCCYLNQCWNIVEWTLRSKCQWNHNLNSYIFIQENAFENVVWKMAAILSQPQCVNTHLHSCSVVMDQTIQLIQTLKRNYKHFCWLKLGKLASLQEVSLNNIMVADACLLASPGCRQPWCRPISLKSLLWFFALYFPMLNTETAPWSHCIDS